MTAIFPALKVALLAWAASPDAPRFDPPSAFSMVPSRAIRYALGMDENSEAEELEVGSFPISDAAKIFERLKREGIRFSFETSEDEVKNMGPDMASRGGTFGHGVHIRVWVRREDLERFETLHNRFSDPDETQE